MKVIHVLRKPVSEGSVAQNVLKHGTGALNIDTSRISGVGPEVTGQGFRTGKYGGQIGWGDPTLSGQPSNPSPKGRWPANLILQHLDSCRCDGVKRVKGQNPKYVSEGKGRPDHINVFNSHRPAGVGIGHADEDGKESVANWICVEGCPVKALDEQSGVSESAPAGVSFKDTPARSWKNASKEGIRRVEHGDKGGASRFFKQVKADEGD